MNMTAAIMEEAMAGKWFRFYDDALDDPKIVNLSQDCFKLWVSCLCVASKNGGLLPSNEQLRHLVRKRMDGLESGLAQLIAAGLLDRTAKGLEPHNWKERQYETDNSTVRVKRFRNGKRNVSETPRARSSLRSDTDTDTDTKTNKRNSFEVIFETFWQAYPNPVSPVETRSELKAALTKSSLADILAGVHRYVATKPADQHWMNPANFLRNERWRDRPAPPPSTDGVMKVGL